MLELILLGTGTSSCLPLIGCLTSNLGCYSCKSTTSNQLSKNVRRNTSAILRIDDKQTILIDCGKSFYNSALSFWSKNQLRQIDAVLLTHPHSVSSVYSQLEYTHSPRSDTFLTLYYIRMHRTQLED